MERRSEGYDYRLFDGFTNGVQVLDRDYRYLYVNAAAATHGRTTIEALRGHGMTERFPGVEQTQLFARIRECMEQRVARTALSHFEFPDGTRAYFQLRMEPVPEGVLISSVDVTDERAHQVLTEHMSDELERIVRHRTAELRARNRELSRIAATASKNLQAPLRTMRGFAHLLREEHRALLDDAGQESVDFICDGADRMQETIDSLLEHALLGERSVREEISMNSLLDAVLADLASEIRERNATVHAEPLPRVDGYRTELRLLLQNLLYNALSYHRPGVPPVVRISASSEPDDSDTVRISVADNGVGMDPHRDGSAFDLLQRLPSAEGTSGAGVGLAHCDKIVGLHGGRIWFEPNPAGGTIFHFTLPPPVADQAPDMPAARTA